MSKYEKIIGGLFLAACFTIGFLMPTPFRQAPAPFVQPSVPSLIPPPLACPCVPFKPKNAPFFIVCPNCRHTLTVQAPAGGSETGTVIGTVGQIGKVAK